MSGVFTDAQAFWRMSLYDAVCLMRAYRKRIEMQAQSDNIRAGTTTAAVYNTMRTKKTDKVWKWTDFYKDMSKPESEGEQTPQAMWMKLKMAFGGVANGTECR